MKLGTITALGLTLMTGACAISQADDAAVRKEIQAGYDKLCAAMKSKNIDGVMKMGTKDFSYTEKGQTMGGEQMKQMMQQQFAAMKSCDKMVMKIDKLTVKGNTATVMSSSEGVMTIGGADGKTHKMADKNTSKDTWVKTPEGWKCKNVTVLTDKMTMDGKPFDPSAMAGGGSAPPKKKGK